MLTKSWLPYQDQSFADQIADFLTKNAVLLTKFQISLPKPQFCWPKQEFPNQIYNHLISLIWMKRWLGWWERYWWWLDAITPIRRILQSSYLDTVGFCKRCFSKRWFPSVEWRMSSQSHEDGTITRISTLYCDRLRDLLFIPLLKCHQKLFMKRYLLHSILLLNIKLVL